MESKVKAPYKYEKKLRETNEDYRLKRNQKCCQRLKERYETDEDFRAKKREYNKLYYQKVQQAMKLLKENQQ